MRSGVLINVQCVKNTVRCWSHGQILESSTGTMWVKKNGWVTLCLCQNTQLSDPGPSSSYKVLFTQSTWEWLPICSTFSTPSLQAIITCLLMHPLSTGFQYFIWRDSTSCRTLVSYINRALSFFEYNKHMFLPAEFTHSWIGGLQHSQWYCWPLKSHGCNITGGCQEAMWWQSRPEQAAVNKDIKCATAWL